MNDEKSREFLVWHQGPDDIHPCETWIEAVSLAQELNGQYERWARERVEQFAAVTVRSWAIPYRLADYVAETGHQIELDPTEGDPR